MHILSFDGKEGESFSGVWEYVDATFRLQLHRSLTTCSGTTTSVIFIISMASSHKAKRSQTNSKRQCKRMFCAAPKSRRCVSTLYSLLNVIQENSVNWGGGGPLLQNRIASKVKVVGDPTIEAELSRNTRGQCMMLGDTGADATNYIRSLKVAGTPVSVPIGNAAVCMCV